MTKIFLAVILLSVFACGRKSDDESSSPQFKPKGEEVSQPNIEPKKQDKPILIEDPPAPTPKELPGWFGTPLVITLFDKIVDGYRYYKAACDDCTIPLGHIMPTFLLSGSELTSIEFDEIGLVSTTKFATPDLANELECKDLIQVSLPLNFKRDKNTIFIDLPEFTSHLDVRGKCGQHVIMVYEFVFRKQKETLAVLKFKVFPFFD